MATVNRYSMALAATWVLFTLQQFRTLSIGGVNPNLLLVYLMLVVFSGAGLGIAATLALSVLLGTFLWLPSLLLPVSVVCALSFIAALAKRMLTGNAMLDYVIAVALSVALLYLFLNLAHLPVLSAWFVLGEVVYNLTVGVLLWWMLARRLRQAW